MALTGIELSAGIVVGSVEPIDKKYGAYASTTEANSEVGATLRYRGLTVGITGSGYLVEYWWKDGTTDSDLVVKQPSGEIFSGSFSGSFEGDGSGLTGVISSDATKAQTVETISTTADGEHFLTFVDSNNGSSAAETVYTTSQITVNPATSEIQAGTVRANSLTGSLSGTATNAVSASHVASAYDTVSVSNATISLTDMGGNTDQITVNNVVNSDTASAVMVASDNETDGNFYITTSPGANGQTVYAHQSFVFNPTSSRVSVNPNVSDLELHFEANSFSGSFSGSFEGDGSGLTGVAPIAGDGIFVTGTTVSVDSGSLIQTATNDSAYNVLFSNSTTPFAKDNTTSHFSYNPGTNSLRVSGSIELGSDDGAAYSPEIRFKVSGSDPSGRMVVFEKANGTEFASIEIDNNHDLVNVLDPDGKRGVEQSFTWKSSGSAAAGLVTRMELTGDSGDLTVYGSISGSSLETSGQVTIGTVTAADAAERTALVIDATGNVQSLELGDAVTTNSGSLTVARADGFYLTDNSSTDNDYNVIFSTDAPGQYIGAQGDGDSFTYNPGSNTLTVGTLVGDVTGTATTASYVSAAKVDGTVASATNATNINVASDGGNAEHFVIFTDSATGNNRPKSDAGLKYNPSTNILTTTVTQANNATTAANVALTTSNTDQAFNLIFTEATDESGTMLLDSDFQITYNPSTDKLSVGGDLSVGGTATVTGDLIVNGTTTTISTENLEVQDSFILLSSGSSAGGDSGIIFGGSRGTAGQGNALFWDGDYNSNQGRLGVTGPITSDTSSPIGNPDLQYYIAGVFVGTEGDASTNNAAQQGNIRIESNEIYIYV